MKTLMGICQSSSSSGILGCGGKSHGEVVPELVIRLSVESLLLYHLQKLGRLPNDTVYMPLSAALHKTNFIPVCSRDAVLRSNTPRFASLHSRSRASFTHLMCNDYRLCALLDTERTR
jgi:hypothetical protein